MFQTCSVGFIPEEHADQSISAIPLLEWKLSTIWERFGLALWAMRMKSSLHRKGPQLIWGSHPYVSEPLVHFLIMCRLVPSYIEIPAQIITFSPPNLILSCTKAELFLIPGYSQMWIHLMSWYTLKMRCPRRVWCFTHSVPIWDAAVLTSMGSTSVYCQRNTSHRSMRIPIPMVQSVSKSLCWNCGTSIPLKMMFQ